MIPNIITTAFEAEEYTGMKAREIVRPASENDSGRDLQPRDPSMRCQLGNVLWVGRRRRSIRGLRDEFCGTVKLFELRGFGRTWAEAAASARRRANS